ncbi:insect cuticle protein [Holotrichia oblita]|uniref:Insect cuticle protein n=1 Tax=Holotrichia oblita TaxID=644536 RepID=A0ACB9T9N7_HOLOL|nr:insect cuticle protein [Holotrichia oblita]
MNFSSTSVREKVSPVSISNSVRVSVPVIVRGLGDARNIMGWSWIKLMIFFAFLITPILTAPAPGEALLNLTRDEKGRYKFSLISTNVTRTEQSFLDGSVKGSYSYLTPGNKRQTVLYSTGYDGLTIEGKYPSKADGEPEDLLEVTAAKKQFTVIAENIKKYFTTYGGDKPVIDLSRQEFLKAVSKILNPELKPVFTPGDGIIKNEYIFSA